MTFKKIEGVVELPDSAGWYSTALDLEEGEFFGQKEIWEQLLGVLTFLLLLCFLLMDFVITVLSFPRNFRRLFLLQNTEYSSQNCVRVTTATSSGFSSDTSREC